MEHKDFDTVFFVLAYEFGHIYFMHGEFLHLVLFFQRIGYPVLVHHTHVPRSIELRDRPAQILIERDCVSEAMILSAGRHLYKYVDAEDYLENTAKEKGLFLSLINFLSSHPIMPKRIAALADPEKKSGKLL